jgi:hypothetical protein
MIRGAIGMCSYTADCVSSVNQSWSDFMHPHVTNNDAHNVQMHSMNPLGGDIEVPHTDAMHA